MSSLTDTVIEGKLEEYNEGRKLFTVDTKLTVKDNAFVVGKEIQDVLWPNFFTVISVNNSQSSARIGLGMAPGDVLHVNFKTTHPKETANELEALLGKQDFDFYE